MNLYSSLLLCKRTRQGRWHTCTTKNGEDYIGFDKIRAPYAYIHIVNGGYSSFYGRPATAITEPYHRDLCATEITVLPFSAAGVEGVPLTRGDFQTYLDWYPQQNMGFDDVFWG